MLKTSQSIKKCKFAFSPVLLGLLGLHSILLGNFVRLIVFIQVYYIFIPPMELKESSMNLISILKRGFENPISGSATSTTNNTSNSTNSRTVNRDVSIHETAKKFEDTEETWTPTAGQPQRTWNNRSYEMRGFKTETDAIRRERAQKVKINFSKSPSSTTDTAQKFETNEFGERVSIWGTPLEQSKRKSE